MDGHRVGVRWSRGGLDAELRSLASAAIGEGSAPPNVSIVVGGSSGRSRAKHQLYVQGRFVHTTASDGSLIRAAIRAIGSVALDRSADALRIAAFLLLDPGGGSLVIDQRLAQDFQRLEPRLRRSGYRVIALPFLRVDAATASVILPDAAAAVGLAVADVERHWPRTGLDDDLVAGLVPISSVIYAGYTGRGSRAAVVADMVPLLQGHDGRVRTGDVRTLASLVAETGTIAVSDRALLRRALDLG